MGVWSFLFFKTFNGIQGLILTIMNRTFLVLGATLWMKEAVIPSTRYLQSIIVSSGNTS